MRILIGFLSFLVFFISCNGSIEGEGLATEQKTIALDEFEELKVDCNCQLTLIPSETPRIIVESHLNLIQNLKIDSKSTKLNIGENKKVGKYNLYEIQIYFKPGLNQIELSQKTKMKIAGTLQAKRLKIELKEASQIDQSFIETKELDLSMKDLSKASISGLAENLTLKASEESQTDLVKLNSKNIVFNTKDKAIAYLNPEKRLEGTAYDESKVFYLGDPTKSTTENGKAIIQKNN